ncbi:MAG: glutamine--tRNA ligase/YqeY domain fusion protein [Defluviitaleaceae bacterium]|nr:glutamine--tRNA ligase/YqeY domain fusion protein [Defluviitaleaceae bacterium]MCL2239906.1 glutamine--tRNA ligase/YqeY domain fusion protein [Defluviitaleaceae bacterium]
MQESREHILLQTGTFIHNAIQQDLAGRLGDLRTRFPPEPGGFLHIGSAKAVYINFELARIYGGKCNLRMDDTNPAKEDASFVQAIQDDIRWLGYEWEGEVLFASDYFDKMYECAVELIEKGLAFVCDMSGPQMRSSFGGLGEAGKESPYRERSREENLDLFARMKKGEFPDGAKTLRAKIDMASPNLNMRDPVIYRILRRTHSNTGDKWCIYPMYDFAHPLEDAIEGITHSLCGVEFEDHRPIYEWYVNNLDCFPVKPRQIEFAEIAISDTVLGKRHIRKLLDEGKLEGWDDPRLGTISGMRRRGYPAQAIRDFLGAAGVSKAKNRVEFTMLEHFVREHLKPVSKVVMAVLEPLKLVIENFPEGERELLNIPYSPDNPDMGSRVVPFSREIYIERTDFMEEPERKFFRLAPGKEVRLKGAYLVRCTEVVKDDAGNVTEVRCTYDPETKSGTPGAETRKVKGILHWVSASEGVPITARLYDTLVLDDPTAESGVRENPDSLHVRDTALAEPALAAATDGERFQFMRQGYFCLDAKDSTQEQRVFNRTVGLKSSYRPTV